MVVNSSMSGCGGQALEAIADNQLTPRRRTGQTELGRHATLVTATFHDGSGHLQIEDVVRQQVPFAGRMLTSHLVVNLRELLNQLASKRGRVGVAKARTDALDRSVTIGDHELFLGVLALAHA